MNGAILSAAIAVSLAGTPVAAQTARAAPPPLTTADANRVIAVPVGRVLVIDLRQSSGTRSAWRMVPAAGLIQVGPAIILPRPHDALPIPGDTAVRQFRVRVTAPGELALTFVNAATFGGADQTAETATFIVEAK